MGNVQTRQLDAKDTMAQRRGSIYWNLRHSALRSSRRERPPMTVFNSKLGINDWLGLMGLQRYETNFQIHDCVEDLLEFTDADLREIGIKNPVHRSKMLSSLVGVQAKRRQSMNIEVSTLPRSILQRKNSCPPIYLTESEDSFDTQILGRKRGTMVGRSSMSVIGNKNTGGDQRRLTWSATNSIYEEIKPQESLKSTDSTVTLKTTANNHSNNNNNNSDNTMEKQNGFGSNSNLQQGAAYFPSNSSIPSSLSGSNEQQEALALKKALEWELNLETRDLRSHAWYHGPLSRQRAEEIVQTEGEFLVRDCGSQPDNYVLTCRSRNAVLHFVINKVTLQPGTVYERINYRFEEDSFDTVPDLITSYVGSGKTISAASKARIRTPCNRNYPLSFYGHKIVGNQLHAQLLNGMRGVSPLNSPVGSNVSFRSSLSQNSTPSPLSSPPRVKRDIPPRLPSKKQRSQSLTPAQALAVSNMRNADTSSNAGSMNSSFETINECDGPMINGLNQRRFSETPNCRLRTNGFQTIARCNATTEAIERAKFTTHSLPRAANGAAIFRGNFMRTSSLAREFQFSEWSASHSLIIEEISPEKPPSPPPKPIRAPNLPTKPTSLLEQQQLVLQRAAASAAAAAAGIYPGSGSDSGNGSGDSANSSLPGDAEFTLHRGVVIKNPRFMSNSASSATLKSLTEFDPVAAEEMLYNMSIPEYKAVSKFDVENYNTLLLPCVDNKPLDGDALSTFKMMLLENGPKTIAEHITRIDISLLIDEPRNVIIKIEENGDSEENDYAEILRPTAQDALNCCGLEMMTLPQGKVLRNDLVERTQCIKLMVAVTILTCTTDMDRAELLSKWIQVAVETKTALGNLYGFCAIMLGLNMPQILKLEQAWHVLRQKFTDSAFNFEAKLRPTLISMNECSNPQAPNTTIPHVLLYVLLKDRPVLDIINTNPTSNALDKPSLHVTCITPWESKADDFGMTINYLHLDSAREFLKNLSLYRKNARIILEESYPRLDELLCDAFRTEFHIKFLWGSKGATASAEDRHSKLEKVLTLMADKFAGADNNGGGGT